MAQSSSGWIIVLISTEASRSVEVILVVSGSEFWDRWKSVWPTRANKRELTNWCGFSGRIMEDMLAQTRLRGSDWKGKPASKKATHQTAEGEETYKFGPKHKKSESLEWEKGSSVMWGRECIIRINTSESSLLLLDDSSNPFCSSALAFSTLWCVFASDQLM